jgi:hypothetical protein
VSAVVISVAHLPSLVLARLRQRYLEMLLVNGSLPLVCG